MDRALYDFAEAAMGRNTDMSWSLSEAVLRRQVSPVFRRCARGELSAEQALDVALDFVTARVANTLEIFTTLFQVLETKIDLQMHGKHFPALLELEEFFLGLSPDAQWATDPKITRKELHSLFIRVAAGLINTNEALSVFCDMIISKKELYLDMVHAMCLNLTKQILDAQWLEKGSGGNDQERITNGEE